MFTHPLLWEFTRKPGRLYPWGSVCSYTGQHLDDWHALHLVNIDLELDINKFDLNCQTNLSVSTRIMRLKPYTRRPFGLLWGKFEKHWQKYWKSSFVELGWFRLFWIFWTIMVDFGLSWCILGNLVGSQLFIIDFE